MSQADYDLFILADMIPFKDAEMMIRDVKVASDQPRTPSNCFWSQASLLPIRRSRVLIVIPRHLQEIE